MIKKLRVKFVIINMSLVMSVLLIVFIMMYVSTSQELIGQSEIALHEAMNQLIFEMGRQTDKQMSDANNNTSQQGIDENAASQIQVNGDNMIPMRIDNMPDNSDGSMAEKPEIGRTPAGGKGMLHLSLMPTFGVMLDENGDIFFESKEKVSITDEILTQAINEVLDSGKQNGELTSLRLRYMKRDIEMGTAITFIDMNDEITRLRNLVLRSIAVGAAGLLAFLAISLFLSYWTLRPAEKAWMQQKQFVADASHELKTPLTVILANTGILMAHRGEMIEEHVQWLESTKEEGMRMKQLIENMLFLAKSDAIKENIIKVPVDFTELTEMSVLNFEPLAYEKGVEMSLDIMSNSQTSHMFTEGDESQMKQLISILLDNACKYAGTGGKVNVRLKREGEHIAFSVNNTGFPIPYEDQSHIFERFYRGDKARVNSNDSFGLGLSIAERIVTNHGGRISVKSNAEEGTTFTVRLMRQRI